MYLEAFGQSLVVINDLAMAQELLEKRSATYSSRRVFFQGNPIGSAADMGLYSDT